MMPSEPYTPSMERVADMYSWAYAWRSRDSVDETDLSGVRAKQRDEFDRALAAHDAEVRADEREKCAQIAEATLPFVPTDHTHGQTTRNYAGVAVAAAIRSQTTQEDNR